MYLRLFMNVYVSICIRMLLSDIHTHMNIYKIYVYVCISICMYVRTLQTNWL